MDKRLKLKELKNFVKALKSDYKNNLSIPNKREKRSAYKRYLKLLVVTIWNAITAPIIYPIWYIFKKKITSLAYRNTSWQYVNELINQNQILTAKELVKDNAGDFIYWLWTYGDLRDPLGIGELTDTGKANTFLNRWWENGFRNPRFAINFMEFRTSNIIHQDVVIDTRNLGVYHVSTGIGDSPDGVYFKWMLDENQRWWFIYEDNNSMCIFYFGSVGLLKDTIGRNGRFETGYRVTERTYVKSPIQVQNYKLEKDN